MRKYDPATETVDAVVIGTGAGGAPLLSRLAAAGMRVVALEAGRAWDPARDFATDEREQAKLFWQHERLSAGGDPVVFGSNNSGTGVGGSTLHFTAYTPRPQPDDFTLHRDRGVAVDWPFGYDELEPYLTEVEQFLGVSGPADYPWGGRRSKPYRFAPLPLNAAAELMQRGCAQLGIRTAAAANAALSGPFYQPGYGWRPPCSNRGFCQAGCSTGAKASMDVTYLPLAIRNGAEIRPDCFVTRIVTDGHGRVRQVIYRQHTDGCEVRQRCRFLFICAGGVESPRLLLMNDLANASGQVGRNFMAHQGTQVWGRFDEETRPYKGIPGGLISEDTHRPTDADFAGGYLLQSIGVMPISYVTQLARGRLMYGRELLDHMRDYNRFAGINILGDCLPYAGNYLELSDELDDVGLPKPRVHFTFGDNEKRMAAHAERIMRSVWQAAGASNLWTFARSAHTIGTCRMGRGTDASVVDPQCRAHDVPNLYVMDNSIFPTALSVNPSLTIMALALRAADQFFTASANPAIEPIMSKTKSFLDLIHQRGDDDDSGDQFGGGAGRDGSGLPDGGAGNFMFATGIECSYPITKHGRRDMLAETGHYERYKEDIGLVRDLGLKVLRYGLPYHRISLAPGKFDWAFADLAMNEMRTQEITPILDLLHFGLPDWLGDFQNPELPIHFADYAEAVAIRYPWVRYYTPVNEIFVTARGSAWDGAWNEQRKKDGPAFVNALKHCCAASILACHRIAKHRNDCVIVQSETAEFIHQAKPDRDANTDLWNKLRFAALDMLYAYPPDADVMLFLLDNGLTRAEYDWFMVGEPPGYQVMGNDYYGRNEKILLPDGSMVAAEDVFGWYQITKAYNDRYKKPVMHTETNHFDPEVATAWLWKQWLNVLKMRSDGVPVLGFTWYSLIDQIDWDSGLAEKKGTLNPCGLYDLHRKPRPVAKAYRQLLEAFGRITIVPHAEMFDVTSRPAALKVQV